MSTAERLQKFHDAVVEENGTEPVLVPAEKPEKARTRKQKAPEPTEESVAAAVDAAEVSDLDLRVAAAVAAAVAPLMLVIDGLETKIGKMGTALADRPTRADMDEAFKVSEGLITEIIVKQAVNSVRQVFAEEHAAGIRTLRNDVDYLLKRGKKAAKSPMAEWIAAVLKT